MGELYTTEEKVRKALDWMEGQLTEDWKYAYKRVGPAMEREYHIRQAHDAGREFLSRLAEIDSARRKPSDGT